jgi:hypothetical protein
LQNDLEIIVSGPLPSVLAGGWTRECLNVLARELVVIKRARKKDIWGLSIVATGAVGVHLTDPRISSCPIPTSGSI